MPSKEKAPIERAVLDSSQSSGGAIGDHTIPGTGNDCQFCRLKCENLELSYFSDFPPTVGIPSFGIQGSFEVIVFASVTENDLSGVVVVPEALVGVGPHVTDEVDRLE